MGMSLVLIGYNKKDLENAKASTAQRLDFWGGDLEGMKFEQRITDAYADRDYYLADLFAKVISDEHPGVNVMALGNDCSDIGYRVSLTQFALVVEKVLSDRATNEKEAARSIKSLREFEKGMNWDTMEMFVTS